ncbi:hypothetical protein [Halopseudomonas oceani]|uniref:hypothetical protein n=1 Tax=Halopseudomonas oceani TaxID=1708783 RepID=UPI002AA86ECF|nr:hypothetical protein [Halopseudomonas oceani]
MDWIESFKEHLSYRLSNPFTPAFLISWSILNFKTILTVLSNEPLSAKIGYLDKTYAHDSFFDSGYMQGLIWPAILALVFVILSPWFSGAVGLYWKWQKNKIKGWAISLDEQTPRSAGEFQDLRNQYAGWLSDKDQEIDQYMQKNDRLTRLSKEHEDVTLAFQQKHEELASRLAESTRTTAALQTNVESLTERLSVTSEEAKTHLHALMAAEDRIAELEHLLRKVEDTERKTGTTGHALSLPWNEEQKSLLGAQPYDYDDGPKKQR